MLWVAASFAVYLSNFRDLSSRDSVPAALIPVTLILDGTVMLDRFAEEERTRFSRTPYWLVETPSSVAGGGVRLDLQGRFQNPLIVTIDAGGKVKMRHLDETHPVADTP